jgi:hypothetical protein
MNNFVRRLTILDHLIKFLDRYFQAFVGIFSRNHYDDFSIGTTANQLFEQNDNNKDYNKSDIHDVFHIYLSKLLNDYHLP